MAFQKIDTHDRFGDLCKALEGDGAFLVVQDPQGKPNVMTIGWATLGIVWGKPMMTVLVRPSRYTYGLIEKARYFSVNVPVGKMAGELEFCGTTSGRHVDKVAKIGLKTAPGLKKDITILSDCDLVYECEIVHKTRVVAENLAPDLLERYYPGGDHHNIYFGKVLRVQERK